uniref:Mating type protein n=1 Tax=Neofusicoccum eucalyptorum TaxID=233969 RepID=A0A1J0A1B0_9PEZI|nr:mating type protein [Neofusicoccum eucalyptorum]APB08807.1 mating type protein [Neofusicoccum eucalyptorum]APB08808.1 mating type protein [Neofusicoccum eucalyptorum]
MAWSGIVRQIKAGATQILLPMGIHLAVGWGGIQVLVNSLSIYLNTTVTVLDDAANNVHRLVFPPTFHGSGVNSTASASQPATNQQQHTADASQLHMGQKELAAAAPQPTTGQQKFAVRTSQPPQVTHAPLTLAGKGRAREPEPWIPRPMNCFILYRKEKHPSVVAANPGVHNNEIAKTIGRMWKAETRATKELYKAKAEQLSKDHAAAHPHYRFAPRRPDAIKRRQKKQVERERSKPVALPSSTEVSDTAGSPLIFVASDVIKERLRASEQSNNELRINSDDFNPTDYPGNEIGNDRPHINMGVASMADQLAYAGVLDGYELDRQVRENYAVEDRLGGSLSTFLGSLDSRDVFDFNSSMGCSYDRLTAATQRNADLVAEGVLQPFNNFTFPDDEVNFDFTSLDGQDTNSTTH